METRHKLLYVLLGGALALALAFGGLAVLAQTGDEDAPEAPPDAGETAPAAPGWIRPQRPEIGPGLPPGAGDEAALAEALDISVAALQAAQAEARAAALARAVADGWLTQEQADQMAARGFGLRGDRPQRGLAGDGTALLAEALGISEETLQAAMDTVFAGRLAAAVEAGGLSQAQADQLAARRAVARYVDRDALQDAVQSFFNGAIDQALADGAITQDQADMMRDRVPGMGVERPNALEGRSDFHGHGGGHGRGNFRGHSGFPPLPDLAPDAPGA